MAISKILITGHQGYIGSVLAPQLSALGYEVKGFDTNYFSPFKGEGDIRKISMEDLKGVDCIIHLAGLSNDPMGELDSFQTQEINFIATTRLAEMAMRAGVKKFIFSSSCSVYGDSDQEFVTEASPVNPLTSYARSKAFSEKSLLRLAGKGFEVVILRNSTVYGFAPRFRNDLVVNRMTSDALLHGKITVFGGEQWRPLIDVRDLAWVFRRVVETEFGSEFNYAFRMNVGFDNYQIKEIASIVSKVTGVKVKEVDSDNKDFRSYRVNFDLFRSFFSDIRPIWGLEKSINDLTRELLDLSSILPSLGVFERIAVLKNHMEQGRLDKNLYWV